MAKPLDRVAKPLNTAKMWAIAQGYLTPDGEEVRLQAVQNALIKLDQAKKPGEALDQKAVEEACSWLRTGLPLDHPERMEPEEAQKVAPL